MIQNEGVKKIDDFDVIEEILEDEEFCEMYWQLKGKGIDPVEILEKWLEENVD